MDKDKKDGKLEFIIRVIGLIISLIVLTGGVVIAVNVNGNNGRRNTTDIAKHEGRLFDIERVVPAIQSDVQHIKEDVQYIRDKMDRMIPTG